MRCLERSEPEKPGGVLKKNEATRAVAKFPSRASCIVGSTHEGENMRVCVVPDVEKHWCLTYTTVSSFHLKSSCHNTQGVHHTLFTSTKRKQTNERKNRQQKKKS